MTAQRRKQGVSRTVQVTAVSRYTRAKLKILNQAAIACNRQEVWERFQQSLIGNVNTLL
jgi:hypothetical protein